MTATISRMGRKPLEANLDTYRGRFAANLRRLRQRRFKTQDDFVDALRIHAVDTTKPTVSGWERGHSVPDLELWPDLAATLKVSVRSLLPPE